MQPIVLPTGSPAEIVAALRENVRRIEGVRPVRDDAPLTSGCAALDRLLPEGGFRRGALIEWLSGGQGSGAGTLAMIAAREAAVAGGAIVVLDRPRRFYPPAAAALGVDLERVIVIRAGRQDDEMWALDQSLRCSGVAAVWAVVDKLDRRWFRRLQLAAESGGSLGLLSRPARVRGQPSWSQVQLFVEPCPSRGPRRLRVEVTRPHGLAGGVMELEIDDLTGVVCGCEKHETRPLYLAAQLAHPTPCRRAAQA